MTADEAIARLRTYVADEGADPEALSYEDLVCGIDGPEAWYLYVRGLRHPSAAVAAAESEGDIEDHGLWRVSLAAAIKGLRAWGGEA
jgi:hypothetical protein